MTRGDGKARLDVQVSSEAGFGLLAAFGAAQAQPSSAAEARLKEKNIVLPPEAAPVANFVNAARVGNLLFMAGNTGGPQ